MNFLSCFDWVEAIFCWVKSRSGISDEALGQQKLLWKHNIYS